MKKIFIILITVIAVMALAFTGYKIFNHFHFNPEDGDSRTLNDDAEKDTKHRYLTIINATSQIINEVHVTIGEGTEIEHGYQKNPDENSFSVKIPNDYDEYTTFTITFIDRYGIKYQKKATNVKTQGRTEVKITEDDYVEQDGDFKRKIDRFLNGD